VAEEAIAGHGDCTQDEAAGSEREEQRQPGGEQNTPQGKEPGRQDEEGRFIGQGEARNLVRALSCRLCRPRASRDLDLADPHDWLHS
jgi:hypothetical protein